MGSGALSLSEGTLWRGQVCEGEKHSELRSPFFPLALPLSGHVAALRCGMLQCVGKDSVFHGIGCVGIVSMGVW